MRGNATKSVLLSCNAIFFVVGCAVLALSHKPTAQGGVSADILEATAFELVDDNGNTLASLSSESGQPLITFLDKAGQVATVLKVADNGASLKLQNTSGATAQIKLDETSSAIYLSGAGSDVSLGQSKDGSFWTFSTDKIVRIRLDADRRGAFLRFNDTNGREKISLGVDESGEPVFRQFDDNGVAIDIR